nr:MAG TPA: hypothetical protein [Caudoviricetes sp.]
MGTYIVPFRKLVTAIVTVEATTKEEAVRKAVSEMPPYTPCRPIETEHDWEVDYGIKEIS